MSPVVQATHPEVRGVAVYTKSDGQRVEVDVGEYVEKLNEEIVALREQLQRLMGQGGGGRQRTVRKGQRGKRRWIPARLNRNRKWKGPKPRFES